MTKVFLNEGEQIEVKGSGKKPYIVKKTGGVVDCSCPAWRNVGGQIDLRVCKHIRKNVDRDCLLPQAYAIYDNKAVKKSDKSGTKKSPGRKAAVKKESAPPVLLAHKWENEDPTGWWISHKLDGCVSGDTKIETLELGTIEIKDIVSKKMGVHVKSLNHETGEIEYNEVTSWSEIPSNDDWYEIETEDGERLVITGNHQVFLPEINAYRETSLLKVSDILLLEGADNQKK